MQLRLVLCIVFLLCMAALVSVVASLVLTISREQADDATATAERNTAEVNDASITAVQAAVRLVLARTNVLISTSLTDYLETAYAPVEATRRGFASGDLSIATMGGLEGLRRFYWDQMKSLPRTRWMYMTTYPNGEWIAYERVEDAGCAAAIPANGWPAEFCRNEESFNWMIHEKCCAPQTAGSADYHYMAVNTETGKWLGNIDGSDGYPRWDVNVSATFGASELQFDWIGQDNGTFCCGYTAIHAAPTDPHPPAKLAKWRQPFMWTTQYLIGWNAAIYTPNGEYLGVQSLEFSLVFLGSFLGSLRKPEFPSEEFFVIDARYGGSGEDEALIASSCQRIVSANGTIINTCGLTPRTSATDPEGFADPSIEENYYLGATYLEGYWYPVPVWKVANIQGGMLSELQKQFWSDFPAPASYPKWNTTGCTFCCDTGNCGTDRSFAAFYQQNPPSPAGIPATQAWLGGVTYNGVRRFLSASSLAVGADRASGDGVLRWVVVSSVNEGEYMQGIWTASEKATASTKKQSDDTSKALDDATILIIIICIVMGVAALIFTFVLVYLSLLPLQNLGVNMSKAAMMDLDDCGSEADGLSAFAEVSTLQRSFLSMASSLRELRNYMPQSALIDSDAEDEDDQLVESSSKGELSRANSSKGSKATSKASTHHKQGGKVAAQAAVGEFKTKMTTIMYVNLKKSLQALKDGTSQLSEMHKSYLGKVLPLVTANKGVAEPFVGDRLMVHFNSLIAISAHATAACNLGIQIKSIGESWKAVAGICSSRNYCGNAGVDGMKRFSIFGSAGTGASIMVAIASAKNADIVVDQSTEADACSTFYLKALTRVMMPKIRHCASVIWACMEKQGGGAEDEWMYQLDEAQAKNPYGKFNAAFKSIMAGEAVSPDGDWPAEDSLILRTLDEGMKHVGSASSVQLHVIGQEAFESIYLPEHV
eukprot:Hpha_TRINITY_DN16408_c3_g1::TRINITY_DN16408_c3_g1_i1::g.159372::m.159372